MSSEFDICALCPRLCHTACPTASGSAREAAVPAVIAATLLQWERGLVPADRAARAASLCTDCGACQHHCHLDRPLPEMLRAVRSQLLSHPDPAPIGIVEGTGARVAIETDERRWSGALANRLGEPIRRLFAPDRLGVAAIESPRFAAHLDLVRQRIGGIRPVVADGGSAEVLDRAGIPFDWLSGLVPGLPAATSSCRSPGDPHAVACCGGGGPLSRLHPDDARRVGRFFVSRGEVSRVADARCKAHLQGCGHDLPDPVDALLEL